MVWLEFSLCLAVILFAGTRLARYGDVIAERTKLGRIWIGLVLIAVVTTMPELATGVSSAALVGSADLALGTLLGSCCFNLLILAILDIVHRRSPILTVASPRHVTAAGWGASFIAIVGASIIAGDRFPWLAAGWVGVPSILILILYLLMMWRMSRSERRHQSPATTGGSDSGDEALSSSRAVGMRFALAAAVVIAAGIWLSFIGDEISQSTGLGGTFVGTLFLAMTTSAPEIVVALTALRMGAVDLAVAGLLGACMLNMAIILPVDLAHGPGLLFSSVSSGHLVIVLVALLMITVVIIGLRFRQKRKLFRAVSWYSPVLVALYAFGAYTLFASGTGL
ncbi:MAG: sodium:calcium antiporter [Dehalococcoidia bacterium]